MNTLTKTNMSILKNKKLYLLDMDGTLYLGNRLFKETLAFLEQIKSMNKRYLFVTNNSSKSVKAYIEKLARLGIASTEKDFFTSSMAAEIYLKKNHPDALTYCMGTRSFIEELVQKGIKIDNSPSEKTEVVLLGYDTELNYGKLVDVCRLLSRDIPYLATNPDYVCPHEFGVLPDCGSFAQMLEHATGKMPHFLGKPNPEFLLMAVESAGFQVEDAVMVGDRLETDILGGINANMTTVCVLSGVTDEKLLEMSDVKPDIVLSSIADILESLRN
ncbi:MAG: HAD-IIA family hydrolase [Bacilli bacterium]|nr:HAD-IIA family hydrolase [Bacilli bacterium]